jgi:hypothetical protein
MAERVRDRVPMPGGEQALRWILETGRTINAKADSFNVRSAGACEKLRAMWLELESSDGSGLSSANE